MKRTTIAAAAVLALGITPALATPAHAGYGGGSARTISITRWWLTPAGASEAKGINSAYPQTQITGPADVPCGRVAQVDTYTGSPDALSKLPSTLAHYGDDQLPGIGITAGNHGTWWYVAPACQAPVVNTYTRTVQVDREQVTGSAWFASKIAGATSDGVLRQGELAPYVYGTTAAKKHVKETSRFVTVTITQPTPPTDAQWLAATSKATGLNLSPAKVAAITTPNSDVTYVWQLAPGSTTAKPFAGGPQKFMGATPAGTYSLTQKPGTGSSRRG